MGACRGRVRARVPYGYGCLMAACWLASLHTPASAEQVRAHACSLPGHTSYPFCNTSFPLEVRIRDLIGRLKDDEKAGILTARTSAAIERLGVPKYDWGLNAIHGAETTCAKSGSCPTTFPNPCALGAAFNASMVREMGSIIATETRAAFLMNLEENQHNTIHMGLDLWSPNININRDPRWGRNQEVPGEDPYWNGRFGVEYTKGVQEGPDPRYLLTAVTLKHWAAYSVDDYKGVTRHEYDAIVTNHDLQATYLPAWQSSIEQGGAMGLMCSYNALNGVPTCASKFLRRLLDQEYLFQGYVSSDTGAIRDIYANHNYTATAAEAAGDAINAGTFVNSGDVYKEHLVEAVQKGYTTEKAVDYALYRSFLIRFRLGLFDPIEDQPYWKVPPSELGSPAHVEASLQMTRASMVLLKNGGALPLSQGKSGKVAIVGPHANATRAMLGNYLGQICPGPNHYPHSNFDCVTTPYQALKEHFPDLQMATCTSATTCSPTEVAAITRLASQVDTVIFAGGLSQEIEREAHDRTSIALPQSQTDLLMKLAGVKKPIVLTLFNGGVAAIDSVVGELDSVVEAFYPGPYGAMALADVLVGSYNPGGKLPVTYYEADVVRQLDFLSMNMTTPPGRGYRYYTGSPTFDFGFGLSYTTFTLTPTKSFTTTNNTQHSIQEMAWQCPSADRPCKKILETPWVTLSVKVTNTGKVKGDEVVFGFTSPGKPLTAGGVPLKKQLFGFQRISLEPNESKIVTLTAEVGKIARVNQRGDLELIPSPFSLELSRGHGEVLQWDGELTGYPQLLQNTPGMVYED